MISKWNKFIFSGLRNKWQEMPHLKFDTELERKHSEKLVRTSQCERIGRQKEITVNRNIIAR
jgi:hypothetical protein